MTPTAGGTSHPPSPTGKDRALPAAAETIAGELSGFRREMLRFAVLQLRDQAAAEDAVQEAMLAALQGADRFGERATLKTWVFSILRNKIVDIIRRRVREPSYQEAEDEIDEADFDPLFRNNGHWQRDARPSDWGNPEKSFENRSFWAIFDTCLNRLPAGTARVFMMREMLGLETDEICAELAMSSNNCWVVLHRARMGLRLCLDQKWFASGGQAK
ncbi:sigma-70 family RNA polymerase sigma factor [Accumulibacter sp.]|uniref:Sigma-70 family RNA polymerase sigma factor n=1 Tax=Candidatus Accumulibacter proximus TaxID=2954385 RepID=A0A935UG21_9PROT|nr:sigma-70 family RNA polymerase sigma factor [Accumulibacter sp.]MBK7675621.1 sigma-70 family RNA polymerase sigma factor [Candidatus Accumulibacter proximus]MBL8375600.1 sigma-70 family RNA polymerase sigma factor [Accumulibacter sp.]